MTQARGAVAAAGGAMMNSADVIDYWSDRTADGVAIRWDTGHITFSELQALINRLVAVMKCAGVVEGDRVAIISENCPGALALIFACFRSGAWATPLNARYTPRELDGIVEHADPRAVFFVGAAASAAVTHAARFDGTELVDDAFQIHLAMRTPRPDSAGYVGTVPIERVALLLYTSGTSGAPKGVMLAHRSILTMMDLWSRTRNFGPGDTAFQALPISHSYGLVSLAMGSLAAGCTLELPSRFDPKSLYAAFQNGISLFQGVPVMFARYLTMLDEEGLVHDAPALRAISASGASLDPSLKAKVEAVFSLPLKQAYGLTEAGPTVATPLPGQDSDAQTIGIPIAEAQVRLVDPQSGSDVPEGEAGELWVKSPGVMIGYYRAPEATAAALTADGWLKTGDLMARNPDGTLRIVGRERDVIIRSGFNVFPSEVEGVLASHPAVLLAGVVGRKVDMDEQVVAFVQLRPGSSIEGKELDLHCRTNLAGYKRPAEIRILEAMPLNVNGKIATAQLRELAAET